MTEEADIACDYFQTVNITNHTRGKVLVQWNTRKFIFLFVFRNIFDNPTALCLAV